MLPLNTLYTCSIHEHDTCSLLFLLHSIKIKSVKIFFCNWTFLCLSFESFIVNPFYIIFLSFTFHSKSVLSMNYQITVHKRKRYTFYCILILLEPTIGHLVLNIAKNNSVVVYHLNIWIQHLLIDGQAYFNTN